MGTKHTPSPWAYREGGVFEPFEVYPTHGGPPVYGDWAPVCLVQDYGDDEAEANARLIAAAPDLLDACAFALTILEGMGNGQGDAANACRAALSKAEPRP